MLAPTFRFLTYRLNPVFPTQNHLERERERERERETYPCKDVLEKLFSQDYKGEQCGFGMDQVVILENRLNCRQMQNCYSVPLTVLWRMEFVCFCTVVDLHVTV